MQIGLATKPFIIPLAGIFTIKTKTWNNPAKASPRPDRPHL